MEFNFFEYLEDYKNGNLSEELQAQMKVFLDENPHYKSHLDNYQKAKEISESILELDTLETLENLDKEQEKNKTMTTNKNAKKGSQKVVWTLIALLLAIAAIWYFVFKPMEAQKSDEPTQIATNYERPVNEDGTKSGELENMNSFEKGKYYFDLNDFEQAEFHLGQALITNLDPDKRADIYYWLAHAQFQLKKYGLTRKSLYLSNHKDADQLREVLKEVMMKRNEDRNKGLEDPGR